MTNGTDAVFTTAIKALEFLAENLEEAECTEVDERITKAKSKLKSALGMVREVYEYLDED